MAEDNDTLPQVNVTVGDELPVSNTIINDNCTADNMTAISSVTSVGTDVHIQTQTSTSHLSHPCYAALNGGRRNQLRNMSFRIELVDSILALNTHDFLPTLLCDDKLVKSWYFKYKAYMKFRTKWNRAIMAQAICEFDLIMNKARDMVAMNNLPDPIANFEEYMLDVKAVTEIAENEPIISKKGKIGKQASGKRLQDTIDMSAVPNRILISQTVLIASIIFFFLLDLHKSR